MRSIARFLTPRHRALTAGLGFCAVCILMGAITVPYVAWVGDDHVRLVALPAVAVLIFLFVLDKSKLLVLIILIRAAIDPVIDATRFAPFLSLGAALNALIIMIVLLLVIERPQLSKTALFMWTPLLLIAFLETTQAPDPVAGIRSFLGLFSYAAVFMAPFYIKEGKGDMRFCIYLLLVSSLVPAAWAMAEVVQAGSLAGRVRGTFPHPNIFAFYLVLVISLAFYLIKDSMARLSGARRGVLALYMAILLVLLVLTKTRSAWAACFGVFLVYGIIFERRYLVYIAVASGLAFLVPEIRDRLLDAFTSKREVLQSNYLLNSYEWRKLLWESAWNWMQPKGMWIGYGMSSFPFYSVDFFPMANGIRWGAHSVYVQWFFEAGIVGIACAGWLFYRLLSVLWRGMKSNKLGTVLIITVVIEYLVVAYSDNMLDYLAFNWYFWFVIGTACSLVMSGQNASRAVTGDGEQAPRKRAEELPGTREVVRNFSGTSSR